MNETTELLQTASLLEEDDTKDAAAKQDLLLPPATCTEEDSSASSPLPEDEAQTISNIRQLPSELQVNILTYLRAYDLAAVQLTCRHFRSPALIHAIVLNAAESVYPPELTKGFEEQPVMASSATTTTTTTTTRGKHYSAHNNNSSHKKGKGKNGTLSSASPTPTTPAPTPKDVSNEYTFEHLRNMELLVVARVLSRPEPRDEEVGMGHYYVSKSWCKTALKWLEWQQEQQALHAAAAAAATQQAGTGAKKKKASKKQQRLRQRKYSDASPPWPNVNVDLLCPHAQLQRCSNRKSARARRKILDKQAWKCLKKLYPESIPLEAKEGECLQCVLEAETVKKTQQQREEQLKQQRKAPLSQPVLRRFYTRTRAVPVHCLKEREETNNTSSSILDKFVGFDDNDGDEDSDDEDIEDRKMPARINTIYEEDEEEGDRKLCAEVPKTPTLTKLCLAAESPSKCSPSQPCKRSDRCPLVPGLYCVVPRAWCHAWRKYMKTGEGGPLLPPDASSLLCDSHQLTLLPPHLESYLYGETPQLLLSKKQMEDESMMMEDSSSLQAFASPVARRSVVGLSSPANNMSAFEELGLTPAELAQQQRAMMTLERQRELELERQREQYRADETTPKRTVGEQLDRENYCCVEIVTQEEIEALSALWPSTGVFKLSFQVLPGQDVVFSTQPCRECDASGMANFCKIPKLKANLRAAHQARVRIYKEQKSNSNSTGGGGSATKPGVHVEY